VRQRQAGIDTVKGLAILPVVYVHAGVFAGSDYEGTAPFWVNEVLSQVARYAIPVFFLTTGYLFGRSVERGATPKDLLKSYSIKLLRAFFAWSAIYLLALGALRVVTRRDPSAFPAYVGRKLGELAADPATALLQGTQEPLWFLPALLIGVAVLSLFVTLRVDHRVALAIVIGLYLVGLLGAAYSGSPLGFDLGFNTRNGPFVSCMFTYLGYWMSGRRAPSLRLAIAFVVCGLSVQLCEAFFIYENYGMEIGAQDNHLASPFYGMGVFMLALARPNLGAKTPLPALGRLTLGIYVTHVLVAASLPTIRNLVQGPAVELAAPVFLLATSLGLTWLLKRWRGTGWLVA
jgi:surface polysaccharide O-acyltransferase-like enzyme